jgi:hypothetical protein
MASIEFNTPELFSLDELSGSKSESIPIECAPEPEPEPVVVKQKSLHKKKG